MENDSSVLVAVVTTITTAITTGGLIFIAFINNRRERADAAEGGIEASLRERIVLRDEQIQELKDDKNILRDRLAQVLEENEEKTLLIQHLRSELAQLRRPE